MGHVETFRECSACGYIKTMNATALKGHRNTYCPIKKTELSKSSKLSKEHAKGKRQRSMKENLQRGLGSS